VSSEDTAGTQPSGRGRVALGAVLAVLLLAVAAGAVWLLVVPFRATPKPAPDSALPRLTGERVLSLPSGDWRRPTWRPDGRALVASKDEGGKSQLWLIPLDGSLPIQLTFGPGAHVAAPGNAWRAERLLYASDESGEWDAWVMDTKTLKARNIGPSRGDESDPVYSPDGKLIAVSSRPFGAEWARIEVLRYSSDATTMDLWATAVRSPAQGDATCPQWSPDGASIMFGLGSEAGRDLWVVSAPNADTTLAPAAPSASATAATPATGTPRSTGTTPPTAVPPPSAPATIPVADATATVLLASRGDQCDAAWLDEVGDEVVFSDTETSTVPADLFVLSNGLIGRLTDTPQAEHSPSPSPDGKRIVFERGDVGSRVLVLADLARGGGAR